MTDLDALQKLLTDSGDTPVVAVPRSWLRALLDRASGGEPRRDAVPAARYLKVSEAAALIGMSVSWLYHHSGEVPGVKRIGNRSLRFDAAELERWAKRRAA